jgi:hypothetical protein
MAGQRACRCRGHQEVGEADVSTAVFEDSFNMLCGRLIGEGVHRKVFECKLRPDLVVKVEDEKVRTFANVKEMQFWCDAGTKISPWLAPCDFLSPEGRVLLQRRVDPLPSNYPLPDKLPMFLTDIKRGNFGLLNGKLVCCDYAYNIVDASLRLKKVGWA